MLRNEVKATRQRFQRETENEERRAGYKVHYKRAIIRAKHESQKCFLENVEPNTPFGGANLQGVVKYHLNLSGLKLSYGSTITDMNSIMGTLLNYHFKDDSQEEDTLTQSYIRCSEFDLWKKNKKFNVHEADQILSRMHNKKALSIDGLLLGIVQEIFPTNKSLYVHILNRCLKRGIFLTEWKSSNLTAFNEQGKTAPAQGAIDAFVS